MSRTTLNIDDPILEEVRRIQEEEGGSLGTVVSRLLADAMAHRSEDQEPTVTKLHWTSQPMRARVDLEDKEAVYRILDADT